MFETNPTATLLLAVGGGGGAGGDAGEVAGAGGSNGPGSDATSTFLPTVVGLGGTLVAGGAGGTGIQGQGPNVNGSAGGGPAMAPSNPGGGGGGGVSEFPPMLSSGGVGGGGYFGGGGGGVSDQEGLSAGAGGGGSGFNDPSTTVVSTSTNTGEGSVTITYPVPVTATTTTSGVLRDAATGAAIPNSCVAFSPTAFPGQTNFNNVHNDGTWSFTTSESGPFDLAFYTTANGDCSQPILPTPVPSWYINQPLSGTDEQFITPPPGATAVAAGASGIVACLGATALPTGACATPQVVLSGHVDTTGPVPLANVCVFVLSANGNNGPPTMTDAQGNWSVSGLPAGFNVVVGFVPFFIGDGGPCQDSNAPPPPPAGQLQPVFYGNVWANLADPNLVNDPYTWAVDRGALALSAPTANVDACITNVAGTVVPRPRCSPSAAAVVASAPTTPAAAPRVAPSLAFTGATIIPLVTIGSSLLLAGLVFFAISSTGRRRWLHSKWVTTAVAPRHTRRHTGPLCRIEIPSVLLPRSRRRGTPR